MIMISIAILLVAIIMSASLIKDIGILANQMQNHGNQMEMALAHAKVKNNYRKGMMEPK